MSESRQTAIRRGSEPVRIGPDDGPATGTDTVTVACKIPNGLHMVLYDRVEEVVTDLGGNKLPSFRSFPRTGAPRFILNGCAVDVDRMRKGRLPSHTIVQGDLSGTGFGLTPGIPKAFWDEWSAPPQFGADGKMTRHPGPGYDFVKTGQVFAAKNDREASAQAREKRNLRSGLEPLDPTNLGERAGLLKGTLTRAENNSSPE